MSVMGCMSLSLVLGISFQSTTPLQGTPLSPCTFLATYLPLSCCEVQWFSPKRLVERGHKGTSNSVLDLAKTQCTTPRRHISPHT